MQTWNRSSFLLRCRALGMLCTPGAICPQSYINLQESTSAIISAMRCLTLFGLHFCGLETHLSTNNYNKEKVKVSASGWVLQSGHQVLSFFLTRWLKGYKSLQGAGQLITQAHLERRDHVFNQQVWLLMTFFFFGAMMSIIVFGNTRHSCSARWKYLWSLWEKCRLVYKN